MRARGVCVAVMLVLCCGRQGKELFTNYTNDEFGFSLIVPKDLARAGWAIIDAEDATVVHAFTPPDTSSWEAVVAPPGSSFPGLSPIFVDIFNVTSPTRSVDDPSCFS